MLAPEYISVQFLLVLLRPRVRFVKNVGVKRIKGDLFKGPTVLHCG